ncbi:MAG: hypothetical protein AB7P49_17480, partial [Bdellovibrionales bacterium]
LIDGFLGRGSLNVSRGNQEKKWAFYKRSDLFPVLYSLSGIKRMIKEGTFNQCYDGSVPEFIEWFCHRFGIYFDKAWATRLDLDGDLDEEYLSLDDVFGKLALCLFLARKRGTKTALLGFLKAYLPFVNKRPVSVYDGNITSYLSLHDNHESQVCYVFVTDKIDDNGLTDSEGTVHTDCDFLVQSIYHGSSVEEMKRFIVATETIVNREKPAHTRYCHNVIGEGWVLPAPDHQPPVGPERSLLSETTLLSLDFTRKV